MIQSGNVIPIDPSTTTFLGHFDITENCVLYGISPISNVTTLRPYEGKFGGGIAIEESTTNLLLNSNFSSISNWSLSTIGSGNFTTNGTWGSINIPSGESGKYYYLSQTVSQYVSANNSIIFSTYFRNNISGNFALRLVMLDSSGNAVQQPAINVTLDGSCLPKRYSVTAINSGGDCSSLRADILAGSYYSINGTTLSDSSVQFNNAQLEQKSFVTSYYNPVIAGRPPKPQPRSSGKLEYNINIGGDFTISFYYQSVAPNGYQNDRTIIAFTNGTNSFNFFNGWGTDWYMGDETNRTRFRLNDASVPQSTFEHLTIVRSGTILKLYRSGILTDSHDFGSNPNFTKLSVCGGYGLEPQLPNGIIDELRIDNVARTDEEVLSWYISQRPFSPKGIYTVAY